MPQVNENFQRLVALPLESKFVAQLDHYSSALLALVKAKKGTAAVKISPVMWTFEQAEDINEKRESLLKALTIALGEDPNDLIKEFVDSQQGDLDLDEVTMAVYTIRPGESVQHPPQDIGIVIEGETVLNELNSVTSACALLHELIYVLNLAYPSVYF